MKNGSRVIFNNVENGKLLEPMHYVWSYIGGYPIPSQGYGRVHH